MVCVGNLNGINPTVNRNGGKKMKKFLATIIVSMFFLMVPIFAMGAAVTGSVQGFLCVTQGTVCPIGQEDPVAAVENVFVILVDAAKSDYYFVPNVDRAVMARHIGETVTIEGTVNKAQKSIKASSITKKGKKVWSEELEYNALKKLQIP
jgi:hypothetical protein